MLNNVPEDDAPAPARSRMPPEERRRQLVGIGLGLLRERPLDAITVDEVARRAGISRGLLFHYFASKQAFHREVAAAGLRRLHRAMWPTDERPADERLRGAIDGYLAFVERRPGRVMEMAGGSWSADPELAEILRDARAAIADGLLAAADAGTPIATGIDRACGASAAERPSPPSDATTAPHWHPLQVQSARAWLAFAERLALDWLVEPSIPRIELTAHLERTFRLAVRRPT
jgi:AcrR family transcriptional regulator